MRSHSALHAISRPLFIAIVSFFGSSFQATIPSAALADVTPEPAKIELKGQLAFWKRTVCASGLDCQSPASIAPSVQADVTITVPSQRGPSLVSLNTYHSESWTVEMSLIWVNPQTGDATPPYLVTQTRLSEATLGVLAECSRYDGVENLKFLLPGSCSGRNGDWMYGVSTITTK